MTIPNLIPRDRRRASEGRRRARSWLRFLRVYGVLLAVAACLVMLPAHADSGTLSTALTRLDRRIETNTAALATLKKTVADLNRSLAVAQAVSDHPDWSLVLEAVARVRGTDATLESFELATSRVEDQPAKAGDKSRPARRDVHTIRLAGYAVSASAPFEFAKRLGALGFADRVDVKDTRAAALGASGPLATTHFQIELTITSGPIASSEGAAK